MDNSLEIVEIKSISDYKKMFIPNSVLADTIIDGLIRAGWKPEDQNFYISFNLYSKYCNLSLTVVLAFLDINLPYR